MTKAEFEGVKLNRRGAIAMVGGASLMAAGGALAQVRPGAPGHIPTWPTGLQRLAPDVYAFIREGGDGIDNASLSNAGLIVGPDNAMVIDSLGPPIHAKEFRQAVLKTTSKPVTRIVHTHHHRDHTNGDYVWGPVEIVTTEPTRQMLLAQPIPAHPYDTRPQWQAGMNELRLVAPTTVIGGDVTYYYGDRAVRLIVPGPAHTAGDIMVYLPKEKILFCGDIGFFWVTPAPFAATIGNWLAVIDRIMKMDVDVIVPGHGPVGGKKELADMASFMRVLVGEIRRGSNAGKSPALAAADADIGQYASWGNPERIAAAALRLYDEWNGTLPLDQDLDQPRVQAEYAAIVAGRVAKPSR
jgi:cyclase